MSSKMQIRAEEEATRLWNRARAAMGSGLDTLDSTIEALELGIRSAEILGFHRLEPIRERFPATIAAQLHMPDPNVDVQRDAVEQPSSLGFRELIDLMSADGLDCLARGMHHGWEDPIFACRRARNSAQGEIPVVLDAAQRQSLLLLLAVRNRLFRYPPPVHVDLEAVRSALPELVRIVEAMLPTRTRTD